MTPASEVGPHSPVVTTRYGVFLTPDPVTCAAVTAVTGFVRAQYGFVSAGAFPPHATLAGSLPVRGGESALFDRPDLQHEVAAFTAALPVTVPAEFDGDTVTLHRFEHPTWDGRWWEAMRWSHVRIWRLGDEDTRS